MVHAQPSYSKRRVRGGWEAILAISPCLFVCLHDSLPQHVFYCVTCACSSGFRLSAQTFLTCIQDTRETR
jgi:hypothetical protein